MIERTDSESRDSLIRRAEGDVLQEELRKYPRGVTVRALLKATVAPEADVGRLRARRLGEWIFSDDAWHSVAARAKQELDAFHSAYPLRAGMARGFPSMCPAFSAMNRNGSRNTSDRS